MRAYRAYVLGINGGNDFVMVGSFSPDHLDDAAAIKAAKELDEGHDIELWDRNRLVARIDRNSHSVSLCDGPLITGLRKVPNESLAPAMEGERERPSLSAARGEWTGENGEPGKVM